MDWVRFQAERVSQLGETCGTDVDLILCAAMRTQIGIDDRNMDHMVCVAGKQSRC